MKSIFDLERQAYREGSTVNKAGNYTKPTMRKNLFNKIKASGKGVIPVNGLGVRLKCLLNNTRLKVEAIPNGT